MKYVASLKFDEDPDYDFCKRMFFKLLEELRQQGGEPRFQWMMEDEVCKFDQISAKMFDSKKSKVVYCSEIDLDAMESMEAFRKLEVNANKQRNKRGKIEIEDNDSSESSHLNRNL